MSTTIDQKVVEMRFDNKHFESNVSTTMSTLDKLKQKLHLDGATKGLEGVNAAANKVNMSGLGSSVETVSAKFSALQVMGVTALANITNSAVNAGKRIVSALTIDPIKTGLSEYETKINAVQVIQSNTRSHYTPDEIANGKQMDDIMAALEELNTYADKTIYNYAQMTSNVGKFVAQGLTTHEATKAVQGLANLAAASGASAEDMARATYQMSQALGGTIRLMDWNSLRNANMATVDLKNTLIDLAKVNGIAIDDMIAKHGTFEQTLSEGWLSGKMFSEAMNIYSGVYSEAELKAKGFTDEQVANFMQLSKNAESAATEVKTFTQLWDVLKETAQSGWTQTWELIIGDFDTAKKMLTNLQVYFSNIINAFSDARNFVLRAVLNITEPWQKIVDKLDAGGLGKIKKVAETIGDATDKLKYFQDVVTKVWRGDYNNRGDNPDRFDLLTKAGYDPRVVQDLVNKGYQYELTLEDIEASHKKFGLTLEKSTETTKDAAYAIGTLSDERLKDVGLTEDEISLYRALEKEAKRTGVSIEELVDQMSKKDGRTLLIESIKNAWDGLAGTVRAIKEAFVDVFNPPGAGELVVKLYGIISAINTFSEKLRLTTTVTTASGEEITKLNDNGEKLKRTFKGILSVVDILVTIFGGAFRIAFKVVTEILSYFNLNILDVTAAAGDALVAFHDWFESLFDITGILDVVVPLVKDAADAVGAWFDRLKETAAIKDFISYITESFSGIREWLSGIKDAENIPKYIIEGLVNGLREGVSKVWSAILEIGKALVESICKFLGIHSPSTVFIAIGGFVIAGLILGLLANAPAVWETIKSIGERLMSDFGGTIQNGASVVWNAIVNVFAGIINFIKNIDFGAILAAGVGVGMLVLAFKIVDIVNSLAGVVLGIGNLLDGIGDMFRDFGKAAKMKAISKLIISFAIAIGVLALAVYKLAELDTDKLWGAIGAVAVLLVMVGIMAALAIGLEKLSSMMGDIGGVGVKTTLLIVGLSAALLILAVAVQKLAGISGDDLSSTLGVLAGMVLGLAAIALAMGALMKTSVNISKVGSMLMKLSIALIIAIGAVKLAGSLDKHDALRGLGVITMLSLLFAGLIAVSSIAGQYASKAGGMIMKMSVAMLLMIGVVKLASMLDESEVKRGLTVIATVGLLFAALIAVSAIAGGNAAKAGSMILMMSIALAIVVVVIKQVADMDEVGLKRGLEVIATLELLFVALIAASHLAGQNAMKAGVMLLAIGGALLILTGVIFLLSEIANTNPEGMWQAVAVVAILEILFATLIAATRHVPEKCVGALVILTVVVGLLAGMIIALSFIDSQKVLSSAAALAAVVAAMGVLVYATKSLKKINPGKFIGALSGLVAVVAMLALIVAGLSLISPDSSLLTSVAGVSALMLALSSMLYIFSGLDMRKLSTSKMQKLTGYLAGLSIVLALLGLVLAMMSALNVSNAIPNAIALSILIASMSGALMILSKIGPITKNAFLAVLALATMAVPLAAFVGILALMQNISVAAGNVVALIALATAMTLLLIPLTAIGMFGATGEPYLGVRALLAMAVPLVAFVGILALMQNLQNAAKNVDLLTSLMTTMTAVLVVLTVIGPFAAAGIAGIQALTILMLEIGALAIVIGALVQQFPALESFLDTGIPILDKLAYGIGSIVGSIVAGFAEAAMSSLPEIGNHLSGFMNNATGFIEGAKTVDESVAKGVETLVTAVLALSAANVLEGLTSWLTNGSSFAELGTQLSNFMTNAQGFITGAAAIDPAMMDGVRTIADTIMILTGANILEGLTSWLTGGSSIENFASQLPILGSGLSGFADSLGAFTDDQMNTVTCAANAIKTLASVSSEIPNTGGLLGAIVGENDLGVFASQFPVLGTGLSRFLSNIGTFTDEQASTVTCAANAIKTLAAASSEIPNTGGLLGAIVGDNDMSTFAAQFPVLGSGIADFIGNIGTFTDEQVTTITCAANAIKVLAEASSTIPNAGGWLAAIVGDNDLGTFAAQLPKVGEGIKGFTDKLGTFDGSKVSTVNSAVSAINALSGLANADLKGATTHLTDFGDDLPPFAENLSTFCSGMPSRDSVSSAVSGLNKILSAVSSIADANSGALSTFADNLKKIGTDAVDKFVGAFTSNSAKTDLKQAAKTLAGKAVSAVRDKYDSMKSAGKYLVDGFAAGITEKTWHAEATAKAMANAAEKAAKEALDINSPSKVFRAIGYSVPEGFAMGIDRMSDMATNSSADMAKNAIDNVRRSISRISDMVNTDIDSQPTIRPVLDLSDVRAGAGMIGSILDTGSSFGVVANVGAISSMMNARGQNGGNDDVVSAISKLNKKLDNLGNTSYTINGVTYDDGSNIRDAVAAITRAALRERRV